MKAVATVYLAVLLVSGTYRATVADDEEPLVTLSVVDAETGRPIERFGVMPGVPYDGGTEENSVGSWQPHLAVDATGGRYEWPRERSYEIFRFRVEADGYRPLMTGWIRATDESREITARLERDPGIAGVVLSPDGTPAADAVIGIALTNRSLWLSGRTIERADEPVAGTLKGRWGQPLTLRADAEGRYRLPHECDPAAVLVVVHESGYYERSFAELVDGQEIRLMPWCRIAGRVLWGDRPGVDERVEMIVSRNTAYPAMVGTSGETRTDAEGRFAFLDVPPGRVQLARLVATEKPDDVAYQFPVRHVDVRAGEATEVVLGGRGREVVGRLIGLDSYEGVTLHIHPEAPHIGFPGDDEQWKGWSALSKSDVGPIVFRDRIPVNLDGTFRIEGLVPERYQLFVDDSGRGLSGGAGGVTVKSIGGSDDDGRQDLVEIRVVPVAR